MALGNPIEIPTQTLECGCVTMGWEDGPKTLVSRCDTHWAELPEEEREALRREARKELAVEVVWIVVRIVIVALAAYIVWRVWGSIATRASSAS